MPCVDGEPGEQFCLACNQLGHLTTRCQAARSLVTPASREVARLMTLAVQAAKAEPHPPDRSCDCNVCTSMLATTQRIEDLGASIDASIQQMRDGKADASTLDPELLDAAEQAINAINARRYEYLKSLALYTPAQQDLMDRKPVPGFWAIGKLKSRDGTFDACVDRHMAKAVPRKSNTTNVEYHGLDNAYRVRFYEHEFYVLSNFSSFNVRWMGHTFPTSEHAYHWAKFACDYAGDTRAERTRHKYIAEKILTAPSAHEAYQIASHYKEHRRADWDDVKVDFMEDILRAKVSQHEYVRRKLLETGERLLVEDSWRDDFWGWGPNRDGKNVLGKLWMQIRTGLQDDPLPATM